MEEQNRDPAKELWDGPQKRDLIETPGWKINLTQPFLAMLSSLMVTIGKEIEDSLFNSEKEGFKIEIYFDKKSEKEFAQVRTWHLTDPNHQDEHDNRKGK